MEEPQAEDLNWIQETPMIHELIELLYRRTAFWPWLQGRIALAGDTVLTKAERDDNRK